MPLLALFIAVPLIEIALFIQVGGLIGLWPTLGIVLVTAVLGTWLVKSQGRQVLADLQGRFNELRDPTEPLAHGAMILFSGALLLTPGFFTDAVGFLLLIPAFRTAAFAWLRERVKVQSFTMGSGPAQRPARDDVVDGTYREVTPDKPEIPGNSGWTRH
ncbi:FxsA family protein [Vannielia litorea]|uniref:FxsA family protein n=1 Tax=Vannielia litorea TaxID=1217970 RepID=UPI001C944715|nr:FxsA family protein [Vannielia litorea]MBY6154962.1 FxsA family protein [Vannielia litorea]